MFQVVLVHPEIPPNTGNIGRLCVAAGAKLHLIHPLGFQITEAQVRRAGLDYWPHLALQEWPNWETFAAARRPEDRWHLCTTKASRRLPEVAFQANDWLLFGCETRGLPESILAAYPDEWLRVPMRVEARSLNLSNAVAVVLYEALRQTGWPNEVGGGD